MVRKTEQHTVTIKKGKTMKTIRQIILIIISLFVLSGCGNNNKDYRKTTETIKDAYIFAYPMLENYKTMYLQAIDSTNPDYKGPFNRFSHMTKLLDADFTAIVAPNNDTYYSFLWLDLRTEPMVITVPPIPDNRYYVLQLIDMFTHNFAYIGTRATGNKGGNYLVAGPNWNGKVPDGITKVFRSESQFNYVLGRILVNGKQDHDKVIALLHQYKVQPLSKYTGTHAPPQAPKVNFLPYDSKKANSIEFISYFNFLLQFIKPHPADEKYYKEFSKYGIGSGKPFKVSKLTAEEQKAMAEGVKTARQEIEAKEKTLGKVVNGWSFVGSAFGSRKAMQDRYLVRAAAAALGMYGNSKEEASNFSCALDADGKPLNAANGQKYIIKFNKGQTPPVNAFWSVTMYKLPEVLFVHNPMNRYSISDRTPGIRFEKDGSLILYIRHDNPGKTEETNWLPAPDGPFLLALRIYYPKESVLSGKWQPPAVQKVTE